MFPKTLTTHKCAGIFWEDKRDGLHFAPTCRSTAKQLIYDVVFSIMSALDGEDTSFTPLSNLHQELKIMWDEDRIHSEHFVDVSGICVPYSTQVVVQNLDWTGGRGLLLMWWLSWKKKKKKGDENPRTLSKCKFLWCGSLHILWFYLPKLREKGGEKFIS